MNCGPALTDEKVEAAQDAYDREDGLNGISPMYAAIEAALGASPAPVAAVAVSVKPLQWYEGEARTGFGSSYAVHVRADGMYEATGCGSFVGGPHATRESAKAAAQSDFNARILSSIIPATKGGEDVMEALREVVAISKSGADTVSFLVELQRVAVKCAAALSAKDTDGVAK